MVWNITSSLSRRSFRFRIIIISAQNMPIALQPIDDGVDALWGIGLCFLWDWAIIAFLVSLVLHLDTDDFLVHVPGHFPWRIVCPRIPHVVLGRVNLVHLIYFSTFYLGYFGLGASWNSHGCLSNICWFFSVGLIHLESKCWYYIIL